MWSDSMIARAEKVIRKVVNDDVADEILGTSE